MSHTHRWSYFYVPGDAYRYCACGAAETVSPDGEHGPVPEKDQGFVKRHIERLEKSAEAIKKTLGPFTFEIDRPKGTTKEWPGGKSFTYPVDYGFFPKLRGEDGEGLDAFVGDDPNGHLESFQKLKPNEDGKLVADETKYLLGVNDRQRETIYRLYGQEINARRVYDSWDGVEKSLERFEASVKEAALAKLARVPTNVKQYRRALQMLEQGDHDFHGTNNMADVVRRGKVVGGPRDVFNTGGKAYLSRGVPVDEYFQAAHRRDGGFAFPRQQVDAAGGSVIPQTQNNPVQYTAARSVPLMRGATAIATRPEGAEAASVAQRRFRLRRVDAEPFELAQQTLRGETTPGAAQHKLKGLPGEYAPANLDAPGITTPTGPGLGKYLTRRNATIAGGTVASLAALYGAHRWLSSRREKEQEKAAEAPADLSHLVGSSSYYLSRAADFRRRHPELRAPEYYYDYGDRYVHRFENELRPRLTSEGQAWFDKTKHGLQAAIEKKRIEDPDGFDALERDPKAFHRFAYDSHGPVYLNSGIRRLGLKDLSRVARTPDFKDVVNRDGLRLVGQILSPFKKPSGTPAQKLGFAPPGVKTAGAFEALNWVPSPYQGRVQSPQEIIYAARSTPALAATQENLRLLQVAQDPYGTGAPTQGVSHHHRRHHH